MTTNKVIESAQSAKDRRLHTSFIMLFAVRIRRTVAVLPINFFKKGRQDSVSLLFISLRDFRF